MQALIDVKAMAKSLRSALAAKRISLSHSVCLELVAKQFGYSDWNTLSASATAFNKMRAPHRAGLAKEPACSFCGKSRDEVRTLIEGGCRNHEASRCVFICDECVEFSAQINADSVDKPA